MRIGALADRLGLNPRTIRYYEQIGLIPAAARTSAGYRDYDEVDRERLDFVRRSRRLGFSLEEITEILALRERGRAPCDYVRGRLDVRLVQIDQRMSELRALETELVALRKVADDLPRDGIRTCRIIEHTQARDV